MGESKPLGPDDHFVAAVEAIYAAAATPSRWPDALQTIADCFEDVGSLLIYQRDDGSYGTIVSPGLEEAQRDYAQREWWRHDIRMQNFLERTYLANLDMDTVTERHLARADEFEAHPFYADFLATHGLKWFAGTALSPEPHVAVALSVQRADTKPPYSDAELALAGRLARHVENALRLGIRLIDAEAAKVSLGDALARLGVGVFLVDALGRILYRNPAAQGLLGDCLVVMGERLTARLASERDALRSAIELAADGGQQTFTQDPRPVLLRGDRPEEFVGVYVLPVPAGGQHPIAHLMSGVKAIVVVTTSKAGEAADPAIIRDLLGLTLGEAKVAALVGAGVPPREAATQLGVSEETARTTLKRVFSKVGVSRQSELATMMTKLVLR
jgi:DNA-binding CsgD family transcriptional regulator/PAS domain-containing protein